MNSQTAYGSLYEETPAGTGLTVTTAGTYYGWVTATADGKRLMTADTANVTADNLTVSVGGEGDYFVSVQITFTCTSNNLTSTWAVFKNGNRLDNINCRHNFVNSNVVITAAMSGVVSLSGGDLIDLRATANSNAEVLTIYHISFSAIRITR